MTSVEAHVAGVAAEFHTTDIWTLTSIFDDLYLVTLKSALFTSDARNSQSHLMMNTGVDEKYCDGNSHVALASSHKEV